MNNPWTIPAPEYYRKYTDEERRGRLKDMNVDRLREAIRWPGTQLTEDIRWPGTQLTVKKKAAERRLRMMERDRDLCGGNGKSRPSSPIDGNDERRRCRIQRGVIDQMSYPGGKAGAGTYQTIINQIPPHEVYIEPFAGSAAIARMKAPSRETIVMDIDPAVTRKLRERALPGWNVFTGDAVLLLRDYGWTGKEFVYCDPPYLLDTRRTKRALYRHEFMSVEEHKQLLTLLQAIPTAVMVSGYPNALYDGVLSRWRRTTYTAMTRGGTRATECLWMNYPEPVALHDYRYIGRSFRERERIKRRQARWKRRLEELPPLERAALLLAITDRGRPSSLRPVDPGSAMVDPRIPSRLQAILPGRARGDDPSPPQSSP